MQYLLDLLLLTLHISLFDVAHTSILLANARYEHKGILDFTGLKFQIAKMVATTLYFSIVRQFHRAAANVMMTACLLVDAAVITIHSS